MSAVHRLSIAPMLDWTDRYYRYFIRLITGKTRLFTEMVTTGAILHGDQQRHLGFDNVEHPLVLQLGGSDPQALARCARIAEDFGYDGINLNVGCPSERVQSGAFGACLMREPVLVADCLNAMQDACGLPVSIKHRIGVDDEDSYGFVRDFVGVLYQRSATREFIVHARKAILSGLSPKDNRRIPPLIYDTVYRLKEDFPEAVFIINGGITCWPEINAHLGKTDGVMLGREVYHNPWLLREADHFLGGESLALQSRRAVLEALLPFAEKMIAEGISLRHLSRHILGLYYGVPGGRNYRRLLSDARELYKNDPQLLLRASDNIPE